MRRMAACGLIALLAGMGFWDCSSAETRPPLDPPAFRGLAVPFHVWAQPGDEACRQSITAAVQSAWQAGFTAVIFQINEQVGAKALTASGPWINRFTDLEVTFDPLAWMIQAGREHSLAILFSVDLLSYSGPPHPWLCVDSSGQPVPNHYDSRKRFSLSPGIPAVQTFVRRAAADLITAYDVDGLLLHNMQYPSAQAGWDAISRRRFSGPGNFYPKSWEDWQREQVSNLVKDVYADVLALRPSMQLLAKTAGLHNAYLKKKYFSRTSGYYDHYQNSWAWIKTGRIDAIAPFLASPLDSSEFRDLIRQHQDACGRSRLIPWLEYNETESGLEAKIQWLLGRKLGFIVEWPIQAQSLPDVHVLVQDQSQDELRPATMAHRKKFIRGCVRDQAQQPIPDAWIAVQPLSPTAAEEQDDNRIWVPASQDGCFAVVDLESRGYKVEVEARGVYNHVTDWAGETQPGAWLDVALSEVDVKREAPFLHIMLPEQNSVWLEPRVHILGRTFPGFSVQWGNTVAAMAATGLFALDGIPLQPGENAITLQVTDTAGQTAATTLRVAYQVPELPKPPETFTFLEPSDKRILMAGDTLNIKLQGPSGWGAFWNFQSMGQHYPLAETQSNSIAGLSFYSGYFRVSETFTLTPRSLVAQFRSPQAFLFFGPAAEVCSAATIEVWDCEQPRVARVIRNQTPIHYGTHVVRLNGPFVSEVARGTRCTVIGKTGHQYKLQLSKSLSAWVDDADVQLEPLGTILPHVYFTAAKIYGDEVWDRVWIVLRHKVVVAVTPQIQSQPKLVVDFFNTHFATTWFIQQTTARIIGAVEGEQIEDDWFRMTLPLKTGRPWGYRLHWLTAAQAKKIQPDLELNPEAYVLELQVKRPPRISKSRKPLSGLTIGLEAGHGGSKGGAVGFLGTKEKDVNRMQVECLAEQFQRRGAQVVLMRPGDSEPEFPQRLAYARKQNADLILSLHANWGSSQEGFLRVSGTSCYYKYAHCRPLAEAVYNALLNLGWKDYGLVGNFNYTPMRDTRIPFVLIEQGFLTHPEDESRLLDPGFHRKQAEAIVKGVENFLQDSTQPGK